MGQTITVSTIIHEVSKQVPGISSGVVLNAGATNLAVSSNSPDALASLRLIWNTAVSRTMILSVSFVAASVPFTLGMEWLNARKVAEMRKQSAETQTSTTEEPKV